MARILFATLDAGGNVPPAVGIAGELARRGHSVRMISHEAQRESTELAGLSFVPYTHSARWHPLEAQSMLTGLRRMVSVFTDRGIGRDVVAAAAGTDLVVVDCMLLGALDAVTRAGLRHAVLFHTMHRYFDRQWASGPVGIVARLKGLESRRLWRTAELGIVAAAEELEPPVSPVGNLVWIGPVHDATGAAESSRPRVLVSLSTINYPGQVQRYRRILDDVTDVDADVVMTVGPAVDPADFTAPANVSLHGYVSHRDVMPTCTAVIGHGGHSTAMRALAHGLPLLVVPGHPMTDQPLVGKAVAAAGAGLTVPANASAATIRTALTDLLTQTGYRESASAIGERFRANPGARVGADRLEALLATAVAR